jgi:SAM-dependent methyltransferase
MRIRERILLLLSKKPEVNTAVEEKWTFENSLSLLKRRFPHFQEDVVGKRIVDFGCGYGYQTAALAKLDIGCIYGVDNNPRCLQNARKLIKSFEYSCEVKIVEKLEEDQKASFDIVFSQNSFEHFKDPKDILNLMKELLKPGGKIYLTFGPPWYSPYGAHLHYFTKVPWVNLLFSERTLMNVRSRFRNDGATKFEEVEGGLNKMSVAKFYDIIQKSGMLIEYLKYDCVKGLNFLSKVPVAKELFTNNITCILTKVK